MSKTLFNDVLPTLGRSAWITEDGLYRYSLWRSWEAGPTVGWVMLNPSKADASIDDHTIRRCVSFSRGFGFGSLVVVNLFAYRATHPRDLRAWALLKGRNCAVGVQNDSSIVSNLAIAKEVILAWGSGGDFLGRDDEVLALLNKNGIRYRCLGHTGGRQPVHPLRLHADTPLQPFVPKFPREKPE